MKKRLILASASPRRRELLEQAGIPFEVCVSEADETTEETDPEALVRVLSRRKADAVASAILMNTADRQPGDSGSRETAEGTGERITILGADTVVALDGLILGKPMDAEDAVRMLLQMQGKTHTVYTGVTLLDMSATSGQDADAAETSGHYTDDADISGSKAETFSVATDVRIEPMTEEEIRAYVATGEPLDAAGSYKIQGVFARHIEWIRGDYTNVVGLPVREVYRALVRRGVV